MKIPETLGVYCSECLMFSYSLGRGVHHSAAVWRNICNVTSSRPRWIGNDQAPLVRFLSFTNRIGFVSTMDSGKASIDRHCCEARYIFGSNTQAEI